TLRDLGRGILVVAAQAGPELLERDAGRRRLLAEGQPATDLQGRALEAGQHVFARDARSLAADLRGDEGVAVTVATDPGAHADERTHDGLLQACGAALQRVIDVAV